MNAVPHPALRVSAIAMAMALCVAGPGIGQAVADQPQSPSLALGRLKAGNDRFVTNASAPVALGAPTREAVAKTQAPFAMVLSCADARVPPEFVFNTGLGELFVVRALAGVTDRSVAASLEYGVGKLQVPLLVVMGHESCDVVGEAAAAGEGAGANQQFLIKAIRTGTERSAADRSDLRAAILANIEQVINDVLAGSDALRQAASAGRLQVVGAYYELTSGRVIFSEPVAASSTPTQK
jgi:carbonic anhydrase